MKLRITIEEVRQAYLDYLRFEWTGNDWSGAALRYACFQAIGTEDEHAARQWMYEFCMDVNESLCSEVSGANKFPYVFKAQTMEKSYKSEEELYFEDSKYWLRDKR